MRHQTISITGLVIASLAWAAVATPALAGGKELFVEKQCNKCHRISSLDIAPVKEKESIVDLAGTGARYDAEFFAKWLRKETDKESLDAETPGKRIKHKRSKWDGTDEELQGLVDLLVTLKDKK